MTRGANPCTALEPCGDCPVCAADFLFTQTIVAAITQNVKDRQSVPEIRERIEVALIAAVAVCADFWAIPAATLHRVLDECLAAVAIGKADAGDA